MSEQIEIEQSVAAGAARSLAAVMATMRERAALGPLPQADTFGRPDVAAVVAKYHAEWEKTVLALASEGEPIVERLSRSVST